MSQAKTNGSIRRNILPRLPYLRSWQKTLLAYSVLVGIVLGDLMFLYKFGEAVLDSDMASGMILADMLNESGSFFSMNWIYGPEIGVFGITQLLRVGLLIFPANWFYARLLTQLLGLCILSGSLIFFMRSAHFSHVASALCAAMVCSPLTVWSISGFGFAGYYILYIAAVAIFMGLTLRLLTLKGFKAVVSWLCLGLLSYLSGLNGVRMIMCVYAPLLLAAFVLLSMEMRRKSLDTQNGRDYHRSRKLLLIAAVCFFISAVGYYINSTSLSVKYNFADYTSFSIGDFSITAIAETLSQFLALFGYQQTVLEVRDVLLSPTGVGSVMGLFTGAAVLVFFIISLKKWHVLTFYQRTIIVFFSASLLICGIVFSLSLYKVHENYWLLAFPTAFAVLTIGLSVCDFKLSYTRRILCVFLAICMAASSYSSMNKYVHKPWRGRQERIDVANWLTDHNFRQGFASFWNGNVLTELSNGTVEAWVWGDGNPTDPSDRSMYRWLQKADHMEHYPSDDRLFYIADVFAPLSEKSYIYTYYTDVTEEYRDLYYIIYTFSNPHLLTE